MRTHIQRAAPVRLLALFVVISGVPLVALGWLGWRVLQQDRALETQRLRERLDSAATLVAGELDRGFSRWEDLLTRADGSNRVVIPSGSVFLLPRPKRSNFACRICRKPSPRIARSLRRPIARYARTH